MKTERCRMASSSPIPLRLPRQQVGLTPQQVLECSKALDAISVTTVANQQALFSESIAANQAVFSETIAANRDTVAISAHAVFSESIAAIMAVMTSILSPVPPASNNIHNHRRKRR